MQHTDAANQKHRDILNIGLVYIFLLLFRLVDCSLNSAVRSHLSYLSATMRALVGGPVRTEWCKTDSGAFTVI